MSGKKAKAARRAATRDSVKTGSGAGPFLQSWKRAIVGLAVIVVLGATFVVPKLVNGTAGSPASHAGMAMSAEPGTGIKVGARVPAFSEADVETGQAISSRSLASQRTLLFFSEGVMCQACFEQIKDLEQMRDELRARASSSSRSCPTRLPSSGRRSPSTGSKAR